MVGRVTSAVGNGSGVLALAYVRREVPADAVLSLGNRLVRRAGVELTASAPRENYGARAQAGIPRRVVDAAMRPARFELATSASAGQRSIP